MLKQTKHAGIALLVFTILTGAFLWMSGTFSSSKAKAAARKEDPDRQTTTRPSEPERSEHETSHGQGEAKHAPEKPLSIAEIETKKCEHDIRQLDCDECRYELGVVKVAPSVTTALVQTAKAEKREMVQKLQVTGEVQFDQTRVVDVAPVAAGRVMTIKARLGQQVKAGDPLIVIHSSEFGEAKAAWLDAFTASEIAAKEQSRQAAVNAALGKVMEHFQKAHAGGKLDADGDCMKGLTEPLGEWRSKLVGAAARLHKTRLAFDREQGLLGKQVSSKSEFELAREEYQLAQAEYDAMAEEVQLGLNLMKLKTDNAARQAEAKLTAAEQRLHSFGLDDESIKAIGQKKEAGTFAYLEIKAPRSGTITAQAAAEGRYVDATHSLFTVADLSNLWVWCDVYERDLGPLHDRMAKEGTTKATVRVPAFGDAPFAGTVDLIGSTLDEHTRTVKVRVQLSNAQGRLKPGMFATVEIELPSGEAVVMVPRTAVLSDEGKSFAFQHWKEDLWLKRDLTVGRMQNDMVEVSGLDAGMSVAKTGAFLFKSDILRAKMGAGCAD